MVVLLTVGALYTGTQVPSEIHNSMHTSQKTLEEKNTSSLCTPICTSIRFPGQESAQKRSNQINQLAKAAKMQHGVSLVVRWHLFKPALVSP